MFGVLFELPTIVSVGIVGTLFLLPLYLLVSQLIQAKNKQNAQLRNVDFRPMKHEMWLMLSGSHFELEEQKHIQKYGSIFAYNLFQTITIMVAEPELVQLVLSKEFTNFIDRRVFSTNDKIFNKFLSIVNGEDWKRMRSIVTPTFSGGKLKRIKPYIDETVQTLLKNFENESNKNEVVSIKKVMGAFTMDTIIQVAFGVKVDSLIDNENPVIKNARAAFSVDLSIRQIFRFILILALPRVAKALNLSIRTAAFDFFDDFSNKIMKDKRKEYQEKTNNTKASSFIELLLEAEAEGYKMSTNEDENGFEHKGAKFMTNDEIIAQCMLFFLAGYDTTATTLTLACHNLAVNPDKQDNLYEAIETTLKRLEEETGQSDPFKLVTFDSLSQFHYVSAVIDETLRLYPPATALERSASTDVTLADDQGHRINVKKGDVIRIPVYVMHRDERNFPQPEKFLPERFIGTPTFHKYSYLPFGSGPRNCVAKRLALMEAKLALLHFIRNYKVSTCEQTKIPVEFYVQNSFLAPKEVLLKVEKRS